MDEAERSMRAALRRALTAPTPDLRELYTVSLSGHQATGRTIHRAGGRILPKPASLAIAQIGLDAGFYLLYRDDQGIEMTDTYHTDLDGAFGQAEFEFNVLKDEWNPTKRQ